MAAEEAKEILSLSLSLSFTYTDTDTDTDTDIHPHTAEKAKAGLAVDVSLREVNGVLEELEFGREPEAVIHTLGVLGR